MNKFKVGDHVWHHDVQANGEIMEVDDERRSKYRVRFFWAHYCDVVHTPPRPLVKNPYGWRGYGNPENRKWQWSEEDSLLLGTKPPENPINRIALVNQRITDKRLHLVAGIPYASEGEADLYIRYGGNLNHNGGFCINEHIVLDKFVQMRLLGEELCMPSTDFRTFDGLGWIIKPRRSYGGKNIKSAVNNYARPGFDYYQQMFPKVREFRAHCFLWNDNPVPFIQEKVVDDPRQLCWNKKQGGRFRYIYQEQLPFGNYLGAIDEDIREKMTEMSVLALKKLKYDSGGIDFGMAADGTLKIFEVNSAMGLRERSLLTYKDVMWKLANLDIDNYRRSRWEI